MDKANAILKAEALSFIDSLYTMAVRLTRDPVAAEDLVHATYREAFRRAANFTTGRKLKARLFTILYESGPQRGSHELHDDANGRVCVALSDLSARPQPQLARHMTDGSVKAALDSLPDALAQALWLRDVERFSYAEIGRMLRIPPREVLARISQARRTLHQRLSEGTSAPDRMPGQRARRRPSPENASGRDPIRAPHRKSDSHWTVSGPTTELEGPGPGRAGTDRLGRHKDAPRGSTAPGLAR